MRSNGVICFLSSLLGALVVRCLTFWGDQSIDTAGGFGTTSAGWPIHCDPGIAVYFL
jgi:hypothetical protein